MTRIAVEPQALRETARQVRLSMQGMEDLTQRPYRAYQGLDWEAHRRMDVEERLAEAMGEGRSLLSQATTLALFLDQKAAAFEEAEHQSSADLEELGARYPDLLNPEGAGPSGPESTPRPHDTNSPAGSTPPIYDGSSAAPGTADTNAWVPLTPPVTNQPGARSAAAYDQVLNQFAVGVNPRYIPRDTTGDGKADTFCNIFVWDATRSMGAEIPHWANQEDGSAMGVGQGEELNANGVADWLANHGPTHGWREASAAEAQTAANQGMPAVAAWNSQSAAAGHVAMVRPGTYSEASGPTIAQAGSLRSNETTTATGFGEARPRYYIHD